MYRRIAFKKCHAISKTTGYKQSEPEILEPNLAAVFSSGLPYGEKLGQERRKVEINLFALFNLAHPKLFPLDKSLFSLLEI